MAATVDVRELNGAGPTPSVVTSAKFCTADNAAPGTSNPIPIVAAQTKYSYWKSHELYFSGAFTSITNIDIYTDGALFEAGMATYIGDETLTSGNYVQATGTPGDTGTEMVTGHGGITAKTLMSGYVAGARKTVDAGPITTVGSSKHVVVQLDVDGDVATPGEKTPETVTWQFDEV